MRPAALGTAAVREPLPTTEAAVTALRALAAEYAREIKVTHDIGADRTSRRSSAGIGVTTDPDGSLPHEAYAEFGGLPRVGVRLHPEDDALITVEGVECPGIPREDVPAFLRSVFGGHLARHRAPLPARLPPRRPAARRPRPRGVRPRRPAHSVAERPRAVTVSSVVGGAA